MISNQESLNLITQDWRTKKDGFEFNKDAGMYVCKAGHLFEQLGQIRKM